MPQDTPQQLSPTDFAAKIKAKYPSYASIPDDQLVTKIVAKYPQYKTQINFGATATPPSAAAPTKTDTTTIPGTAFHYGRFQAPAGTEQRKQQDSPFTKEKQKSAAITGGEVVGSLVGGELAGGAGLLARMGAQFLGAGAGHAAGQAASGQVPSLKESAMTGAEFATAEGIGGALIKAGETLAPAQIKKLATVLFHGKMEEAGKAIDFYLNQPALAGIKLDIATPLKDMLDKEIGRADRVGATSLANRLRKLKVDWVKSYNLDNLSGVSLSEANAFKREISQFTNYAGEANKVGINKIQKQAAGIAMGEIERAAPGVKPLNEAYGNLATTKKAVGSSARKATSGYTGAGLTVASSGLKGTGKLTTDALKAAIVSGSLPPVPAN